MATVSMSLCPLACMVVRVWMCTASASFIVVLSMGVPLGSRCAEEAEDKQWLRSRTSDALSPHRPNGVGSSASPRTKRLAGSAVGTSGASPGAAVEIRSKGAVLVIG